MPRQIAADHLAGTVADLALPEWNDTTRTVTTYDEAGAVTSTRPYTVEENAAADAAIAAQAAAAQYEAQQAADRGALDALAMTASAAHTDCEPWQQPTGAHDAVPLGATVTHGGKTWESLIPFNVWAPGVSGWREVVAVGYPAWVQPTGAHDAYTKGARVSFEGSDYESLIDGNIWSPTGYPAGWRLIT